MPDPVGLGRKMLARYRDNVSYVTHLQIAFTLFAILFAAHMLTCFWFLAGTGQQTLGNGVWVSGLPYPLDLT